MNTETSFPPVSAEAVVFAPWRRRLHAAGEFLPLFLWQLVVIAAGILVGAIVALFAGLFLGWLNIAC